MFSLHKLVGHNCLGGGHNTLADGNAEMALLPFDEYKMMQIIKKPRRTPAVVSLSRAVESFGDSDTNI